MLAPDRAYELLIAWRRYEKYRVLTAVLRLAKYFYRAAQNHFANLRAEILEGAPTDRMKRKVAPRAMRATHIRLRRFGLAGLDGHHAIDDAWSRYFMRCHHVPAASAAVAPATGGLNANWVSHL